VGHMVLKNGGWLQEIHSDSIIEKAKKIVVHNRQTGKLENERIPNHIKVVMRIMYSTGGGRYAVETGRIKKLLEGLTVKQGKKYNQPTSVSYIPHFIEFFKLEVSEIRDPLDSFGTFNEFFYRKLKPEARPIFESEDSKVAVSPADCRMHVFPTISEATHVWIKGHHFTLSSVLNDALLADQYKNGSLVISRLAPQDYHRFHTPVSGTVCTFIPIDGTYFTVNPVAITQSVDVYSENKRVISAIDSPEFGKVLFIAVGATLVGSIHFTVTEGQQVKKGDEMGYFAFGGSTVLLLFLPNSIVFDEDLVVNSAKPMETLVKMGVSLGRSTKQA